MLSLALNHHIEPVLKMGFHQNTRVTKTAANNRHEKVHGGKTASAIKEAQQNDNIAGCWGNFYRTKKQHCQIVTATTKLVRS